MTTLGPLYHWSPKARRLGITTDGLTTDGPRSTSTTPVNAICCSTDPHTAWEHSGALKPGIDWDLWQIALADTDEVHVLPQWGGAVVEVRVRHRIPADRVTWIGERSAERR